MSTAMFIASSQMRFSFLGSDIIVLSQVDNGLPRGLWYGSKRTRPVSYSFFSNQFRSEDMFSC